MTIAGAGAAVVESLAAISAAEWIAVLLALAYLLLAVRQNPWCWACAIASAGIYLVLFARGGLYMQSALQVFYVAMSIYGWYAWRGGARQGEALAVSRWGAGRHAASILAVLAVAAVNGALIPGRLEGWVPFVDAFVAWGSVLATWLVARKVLENWLYWIVLDTVAAGLYWTQGFQATAVLFLIYVVIAVRGYLAWRADLTGAPQSALESRRG